MTPLSPSMSHPKFKLGLLPSDPSRRVLKLNWAAGVVPDVPPAADHMGGWSFDLGANDRYGTCGPVSVANCRESVTAILTGREDETQLAEIFDLYKRSGNPSFDPRTGRGDNGVVMSVMMSALQHAGLGGDKPLAYAQLADLSDRSIYAAVDRFGGVILAVSLQVAQQIQTDRGLWDYSRSSPWGGHAIYAASYDQPAGRVDVVTWAKRVGTTAAFRARQLDEVWVVIWPEHVSSGRFFHAGIDLAQFARDYEDLTGRPLPIPLPPPAPPPLPDKATITVDLAAKLVNIPPGWTCAGGDPH